MGNTPPSVQFAPGHKYHGQPLKPWRTQWRKVFNFLVTGGYFWSLGFTCYYTVVFLLSFIESLGLDNSPTLAAVFLQLHVVIHHVYFKICNEPYCETVDYDHTTTWFTYKAEHRFKEVALALAKGNVPQVFVVPAKHADEYTHCINSFSVDAYKESDPPDFMKRPDGSVVSLTATETNTVARMGPADHKLQLPLHYVFENATPETVVYGQSLSDYRVLLVEHSGKSV